MDDRSPLNEAIDCAPCGLAGLSRKSWLLYFFARAPKARAQSQAQHTLRKEAQEPLELAGTAEPSSVGLVGMMRSAVDGAMRVEAKVPEKGEVGMLARAGGQQFGGALDDDR